MMKGFINTLIVEIENRTTLFMNHKVLDRKEENLMNHFVS